MATIVGMTETSVESVAKVKTRSITWTCDACGFKTDDEGEATAHYAKSHAFRAKAEADGIDFLWFDDAAAYAAWTESCRYGEASSKCKFVGPGWYGVRTWLGPCGRGCCERDMFGLFPLQWFRERNAEERAEIDAKEAALAALPDVPGKCQAEGGEAAKHE
jgi:hypothetical protein